MPAVDPHALIVASETVWKGHCRGLQVKSPWLSTTARGFHKALSVARSVLGGGLVRSPRQADRIGHCLVTGIEGRQPVMIGADPPRAVVDTDDLVTVDLLFMKHRSTHMHLHRCGCVATPTLHPGSSVVSTAGHRRVKAARQDLLALAITTAAPRRSDKNAHHRKDAA